MTPVRFILFFGREPRLDIDKVECINDDEANKPFTREYRKGYELVEV